MTACGLRQVLVNGCFVRMGNQQGFRACGERQDNFRHEAYDVTGGETKGMASSYYGTEPVLL